MSPAVTTEFKRLENRHNIARGIAAKVTLKDASRQKFAFYFFLCTNLLTVFLENLISLS